MIHASAFCWDRDGIRGMGGGGGLGTGLYAVYASNMNIVRIYMINQMITNSRVFSSWAESGSKTVQLAQLLIHSSSENRSWSFQ